MKITYEKASRRMKTVIDGMLKNVSEMAYLYAEVSDSAAPGEPEFDTYVKVRWMRIEKDLKEIRANLEE